jgi:transposase
LCRSGCAQGLGSPWLKTNLIQCAGAAARTKNSYLQAQYLRLKSRRGAKTAIGAVAASLLPAAYRMLKNGTLDQDPGPNYFDQHAKSNQTLRLLTRLKNLSYAVQITPIAA